MMGGIKLRRRPQQPDFRQGRLPEHAPLANPFVPFQNECPARYEPPKAIIRGTLYPGLDLPFMGKVNREELPATAKTRLQTLMFVLQELALYLDTHRDDREALEMYQNYQQMYHECMMEYNKNHRPTNHRTPTHGDRYAWLDDPWPWEYCANKEG